MCSTTYGDCIMTTQPTQPDHGNDDYRKTRFVEYWRWIGMSCHGLFMHDIPIDPTALSRGGWDMGSKVNEV